MTDPAIEAVQRIKNLCAQGKLEPRTEELACAQEVLRPLRELHKPVNAHGSGNFVCCSCWDSMSRYFPWPCATAQLIYSTEELL